MEGHTMYYLFIVNNYYIGGEETKGRVIVDILLKRNYWLFNRTTANLKRIKPADEVIIYVAGKNSRYFYANIMIAGLIEDATIKPSNKTEESLFEIFPLGCPVTVLNVWSNPLYMANIKNDLNFIKDKKNYGLFLRQPTKIISKQDYEYIIDKATVINSATVIESSD